MKDNPLGICLFNSSGWTITNNKIEGFVDFSGEEGGAGGIVMITSCGGELKGIPPKVVQTKNNLIAFNHIYHEGALTPNADYFGIMFENAVKAHAAQTFDSPGGPVENNKIVHNKVMIRDLPACGLCLYDYNPILEPPEISTDIQTSDNLVGFNDFRGCTPEIIVIPPYPPDWPFPPFPKSLLHPDYNNVLSRNLGTGGIYDGLGPNRAYDGVPPRLFIPFWPKF